MNVDSTVSLKVQELINFVSSLEPLEKASSKSSPPSPLHKRENTIIEQKSNQFPNYIYDPSKNNLEKELLRLQSVYGTDYKPLIPRQFVYGKKEEIKKGGRRLRIMQFNLLADGLVICKSHPRPPREVKNFKYRGFRILEEIVRCKPDIVTLQEVDHFNFLLHYLEPYGKLAILF